MSAMITKDKISHRRLLLFTVSLYLVLWLAELASKTYAVLQDFSGDNVTSSFTENISLGARVIGPAIILYILKLMLIYALFASLNAYYTILATNWIVRRYPSKTQLAPAIAFLAVNGTFLGAVYGLNAALYPASELASVAGSLTFGAGVEVLRIVATSFLVLYLGGFFVLNSYYARKPAMAASLIIWAGLLLAPLDPAFVLRKTFSRETPTTNKGPNVIIIGLDSLNPMHTGYFGYPLHITPHLDSFLDESIVFRNCYTPIARTFPAWYSILTGQYPKTSGVRLNLTKRKYIKSANQTLGNILKKKGYTTAHFTDEVRFSNISSQDGFDALRHPVMGIKDFVFGSFHDFSLTNVFFNNPLGFCLFPFLDGNRAVAHLYDGRYFINDLISSIDRLSRRERLFLVAHLCIAHWPYIHASPREFPHQPGADPVMQLYDSAVSRVDEELGRILSALKAKGLFENSTILVLSDHGESAEGHGSDLRDPGQNRTLLAWKPAGSLHHREVDGLVRTIDIAPTILDVLGDGLPNGYASDGMSLRPWLDAVERVDTLSPDSVIMETEFSLDTPGGIGLALQSLIEQGVRFYEFDREGYITVRDEFHDVLIRRRNRAILTPDWKLVRDVIIRGNAEDVRTALYDVRTDPLCKKDVSSGMPEVFKDLWDRLSRYYGSEVAPRASEVGGRS